MLADLTIENFVLIKNLQISFPTGLTVITGETGAGKSLLVRAMKLMLGARSDTGLIRDRTRPAVIQAIFNNPELPEKSRQILEEMEIHPELDGELIIRRVIKADGPGRVFINGAAVPLNLLRQIVPGLLAITSQHEYHNLMKREEHRRLLDGFGGLVPLVNQINKKWSETEKIRMEIASMKDRIERSREEIERLQQEAELIDRVSPVPGEEEKLEQKRQVMRSSRELRILGQEIYALLYSEKGAVLERLNDSKAAMEKMTRMDQGLGELFTRLESIIFESEDLAYSIRDYLHQLPVDLTSLEEVEERLYQLKQLKRRFGPELQDVLAYRQEIDKKLRGEEDLEQEIERKKRVLQEAEEELCKLASTLRAGRKETGQAIETAVIEELNALNLEKTRFAVQVSGPDTITPEAVGPTGADRVEFLFTANPDRPLSPLSAVASGGELSRVMLALQVVFARREGLGTVIFDEVDTGIGGEVAEKVGCKMAELARSSQVIAITHFPQIAAAGDHHLVVTKRQRQGVTTTEILPVSDNMRIEELVRMLGGESEAAREYAKELLGTVFRRT